VGGQGKADIRYTHLGRENGESHSQCFGCGDHPFRIRYHTETYKAGVASTSKRNAQ
jgi:ribosomal protein L37E